MISFARKSAIVLLLSSLVSCSISKNFDLLFHGDASLVISTNSLVLTEGGQAGTFSISLASKPSSPVSIALAASDSKEARISPQSLSFTPDDFSIPQSITVFPLADCLPDGNKNITIDTTQVNSADSAFDSSLHPGIKSSIDVTVNDSLSSLPQLFIQANSPALTTSEDGQVDKFLVALSCAPTQPVTVNLSSSNSAEGVIDTNSVTLDSTNYGLGALVTVTGQPDCVSEPDIAYSINASTTSTDTNFNGLSGSIGAVNKNVALSPGLLLLNSTGQLNRGMNSYNNFQVMLTCSPSAPVNLTASTSSTTGVTTNLLSPAGTYTFTSANWNSPLDVIAMVTNDVGGSYDILLDASASGYGSTNITVADSGFRGVNITIGPAGFTGQVILGNGADQISFSGAGTFHWTYSISTNYAFKIVSSPAGYICAIKEKQFGTPTVPPSSINLTINCVAGQMNSGTFLNAERASQGFGLYEGKVSSFASVAAPDGIVSDGTNIFVESGSQIMNSTIASPGFTSFINYPATCTGGVMTSPGLIAPTALASDGTNLYVGDHFGHVIFKYPISLGAYPVSGVAPVLIAGTGGGCSTSAGNGGSSVDNDNPLLATFNGINSLIYHNGYLYISEYYGRNIRKMNLATGKVTTVISLASSAGGITVVNTNGKDYLYFTTGLNDTINRIDLSNDTLDPSWQVGTAGTSGMVDGPINKALLFFPLYITSDKSNLYVEEYGTSIASPAGGRRIRKINLKTNIVSVIAGPNRDNTGVLTSNYNPGPVNGATAIFAQIRGITTDGRSLYVSDSNANLVAKISDNGLVGYWPLSKNTNDYNSDNFSGAVYNTNNLSNSGSPVLTSGRYNETSGAIDTSSGYLTGSDTGLPMVANPRSMCYWVKPKSLPSSGTYMSLIGYGTSGPGLQGQKFFMQLYNSGGDQRIQFTGQNRDLIISRILEINVWSHLCTTYDGINVAIFINGHLAGKTPLALGTVSNSVIQVGKIDTYSTFNGSFSDVRIYSRVLNESEINELAKDAASVQVGNSYNNGATGLLSQYSFDGVVTGGGANDSGPVAHPMTACTWNGTACNAGSQATVNGKDGDPGGAYIFNGTSQYLYAANDTGLPMGSHPRTMCAWINPTSYPASGWGTIVLYGARSGGGQSGLFLQAGGKLNFDDYGDAAITTGPPINTWSHVCVTIDESKAAKIYINGIAQYINGTAQKSYTLNSLLTTSGYYAIGTTQDPTGSGAFFNGKIDDVRIYNNALSSIQIRQLANQLPNGLVASYDFNGDANDVSGWGTNLGVQGTSPVLTSDRNSLSQSAYQFNGNGFFQSLTTNLPLPMGPAARTQCAWVNPVINSNWHGIMNWGQSQANGKSSTLSISGVDNSFQYSPYNTPTIGPAGMATAGKWFHVCGVYQGGATNAMIYVNGVLVASNLQPSWSTPTGFPFQIGSNNGAAIMEGTLDNVQVYNWPLNQSEIIAFSSKKVFIGGLSAMYVTNVDGSDPKSIATSVPGLPGGNQTTSGIYGFNNSIFWVMKGKGLYVSQDGGNSFVQAIGGTLNALTGSGNYIFTGGISGLYVSSDGGATFNPDPYFSGATINDIFMTGSNLYVATSTGLEISGDNGGTYFQSIPGGGGVLKVFKESNNLFVIDGNKQLFLSTNNGTSWSAPLTSIPAAPNCLYSDNGVLYINNNTNGYNTYDYSGTLLNSYLAATSVSDIIVKGPTIIVFFSNATAPQISTNGGSTFINYGTTLTQGSKAFLAW